MSKCWSKMSSSLANKTEGFSRVGTRTLPMQQKIAAIARRDRARHKTVTAYLFLTPYLIIFIIFLLLPAIASFFISFTDWRILGDPEWVGFKNFENMFKDRFFWQAFRNTLAFTG